MIHSEPEVLLFVNYNSNKQYPSKVQSLLLWAKVAKRIFASAYFIIPYQVWLTVTVDKANFAASIHSAKNVSKSANFAARIRQILPVRFTFFADSLHYKFYIHSIQPLALKIYVKYILIYMYFILILYLLL